MKNWFARFGGGGGDGVAPPTTPTGNAEMPNEVLLGPEESASTVDIPLHVWSAVAAIAAAIYQWIRSLPLWSPAAAVVADALRPLLIHVVGFSGFLLSLRPSSVVPLPRPFRCAPPRSFGGDSAVLANKRGERPPAGARLGGGGGTSSTTASRADKSPPDSDTPKAAAASAIPDPISAALRATGSAVDMLLHTAQAPALTMQLFFVSVLLASVVIVVDAERVRNSPRRKADGTAIEHAIDVARPNHHQREEEQKEGWNTVGELIRLTPRSIMRFFIHTFLYTYAHIICIHISTYLMICFPSFFVSYPIVPLFHRMRRPGANAGRADRRTDPPPSTTSTARIRLKRSVAADATRPDPSSIADDDAPLETAEEANVDVGLLEASPAWALPAATDTEVAGTGRRLKSSCPKGFVDCYDGYLRNDPTTSCYEACDNGKKCCTSADSCDMATACIKKDSSNPNCDGDKACYKVGYNPSGQNSQPKISGGSCTGEYACGYLASYGGDVSSVSESCTESSACYYLAVRGKVGSLKKSCTGTYACFFLAGGGTVGAIFNSCNATNACLNIAYTFRGSNSTSFVGSISESCNAEEACFDLAYNKGTNSTSYVGSISESCNAYSSCNVLAYNYDPNSTSYVGSISKSCNAEEACFELAHNRASSTSFVRSISESCNAYGACFELAFNKRVSSTSYVGSISESCNAENACEVLAINNDSNSTSYVGSISESCNAEEACFELAHNRASSTSFVRSVSESCNAYGACFELAYNKRVSSTSYVGSISESCNAHGACKRIAYNYGFVVCGLGVVCGPGGRDTSFVGSISESCNAHLACFQIAYSQQENSTSFVRSISGSCNAPKACYELAYNYEASSTSYVGDISNSCTAYRACNDLARYGGEIGDICNSCRDGTCCEYLCSTYSIYNATKVPPGKTCDPATNLLNFCNPSNATMVKSCKAPKMGKSAKSGKAAKAAKSS